MRPAGPASIASSALALVALLALATVGGCITDRVLVEQDGTAGGSVAGVTVDDDVVARAKADTEQLRGLPFERDVPLEIMTVEQLEEWLNRYYDDYKVALKKQDYFYHKMGILPPTRDSASTWKGFIGGFAGGVYDNDRAGPDGNKGTMILVQDYAWWSKIQLDMIGVITGMDLAYEVFLAHELTHALQDQHFHLDRLLDDVSDDDVRMVQKTLLESEANVTGMAHFAGMRLDDVAQRKAFFAFLRHNNLFNAPILAALAGKTPSFFSRQTFAQYELGLDWVEARLDDGEWQQVVDGMGPGARGELALAYGRVPGTPGAMPASTEQLLFADKRLDPPRHLPRLVLDDERRFAALPHAVHSSSDVFGALALKHWIEQPPFLPGFGSADDVARGWGGDRADVFVDDDDSPILLWRLLADSDDDAVEIAAGLRERFTRSLRPDDDAQEDAAAARVAVDVDSPELVVLRIAPAPAEKRRVRTTRPERLAIARRGIAVVVVNGATDDVDLPLLLDALFDASEPVPIDPVDKGDAQAAAVVEQRDLRAAIARVPPHDELTLNDRLVLPERTMALRAGAAVVVVDDPDVFGDDAVFVLPEIEARWGFREHLELGLPAALTVHSDLGPFMIAAGIAPRALPLFDPIEGTWSARVATTMSWQHEGQAGPTLAATLQIETAPRFTITDLDGATHDDAVRFGLTMRPLPQLVLQPALSFEDADADDAFVVDVVRLGGVLQRGFADAPLVELEVIPGLMAYWAGSWGCRLHDSVGVGDEKAGDVFAGLVVVEQRHAVGLLLYF